MPNIESYDFTIISLYQCYKDHQIRISHDHQTLDLVTVSNPQAALLGLEKGSFAFMKKNSTYDQSNRVIEYTLSYSAAEKIENYIAQNQLQPHDRLPSERQLAQMFHVNRITLREALARLENEHLIYTLPGSGTYAASRKLRINTGLNYSFHDFCAANGYQYTGKVIKFYQTSGTDFICKRLSIVPGSQIYILKRLFFIDQKPALLETTHLPVSICPDLGKFDFEEKQQSLYRILKDTCGMVPCSTRYSISMVYSDAASANLLNVKRKTPLFSSEITTFTENGQTIEYCQALSKGNFFGINSELYPAST